jgi:hypothetical protein
MQVMRRRLLAACFLEECTPRACHVRDAGRQGPHGAQDVDEELRCMRTLISAQQHPQQAGGWLRRMLPCLFQGVPVPSATTIIVITSAQHRRPVK